jgi:superfamily I DNA/RNA helicase
VRAFINPDGESFADELPTMAGELAVLSNDDRKGFRDFNAGEIAIHRSERMLVVAGPGSGKSFLFRNRIKHWLPLYPEDSIYVSSFVRKLVRDLETEIRNDTDLSEEDRSRVTVTTLHGLARSIVERSGGTASEPLSKHVHIVAARRWLDMVWRDVLQFHSGIDPSDYSREALDHQFHTEEYEESEPWVALLTTYMRLCRFFNAIGFADMIVRARQAVEENPGLNRETMWILDEFQDFNPAETHLIEAITATARGVLVAGDDDQALYQQLKASSPETIVSYYDAPDFSNAMLPFCSRCDYFICLGAAAFISRYRSKAAIDKIYLPLKVDDSHAKIQMVATIMPSAAVDYIAKFLEDRKAEIEAYEEKLKSGEESDPFLLILTPDKKLNFYRGSGNPKDQLIDLVAQWRVIEGGHSEDYRKVQTFCSVAWYPNDNFALRQVLDYMDVPSEIVHAYLAAAIGQERSLAEVLDPPHSDLIDLATRVAESVTADGVDAAARAISVAALIDIDDVVTLTAELEAEPIGVFGNLADDEAVEVIETAGAVAAVEIMTMFQSKGLSAQHVIVIGCDDVNLKRTAPLTFFVALTRTRHSLHLITSLQSNGSHAPHEYLTALPEDCCDFVAYKKGDRSSTHLTGMAGLVRQLDSWRTFTKKKPGAVKKAAKKAVAAKKAPLKKSKPPN